MVDVWILAAKRTPIGKAHGQFRNVSPEALAAAAIRGALQQAGVPAEAVDEVILGNAVGPGGNLARVALLAAGLPASVPGLTVDRQCGGGLEAVRLAAALIRSGAGRCYVAGGVESTSQEPLRISAEGVPLKRARFAPDDLGDPDMGEAAETLAERLGISREAQDRWAHRSQTRTLAAIADGLFASELVPVPVPGPTGKPFVDRDETLRRPLPLERLRRLPPAFREYGTITAGNACRRNDGAAALVLASGAMLPGLASATGLRTLARLLDVAVVGVPPELPGLATAAAVQALLERTGLGRDDIDLYE
ncbi:MAG TPA: thiolase family protein, partial [Bacillota bacterium]